MTANLLSKASVMSFFLGAMFSICFAYSLVFNDSMSAYISVTCLYHFLEFFMTAAFSPTAVSLDSFLLWDNYEYYICIIFSAVEYILRNYWLNMKGIECFKLGLLLSLGGLAFRYLAMYQAKAAFTHQIAYTKSEKHKLVTSGVYSIVRHPSYIGFFVYATGSQIMLGNPISFLLFAVILYVFFRNRIKEEEVILVEFYGDEYTRYQSEVPAVF